MKRSLFVILCLAGPASLAAPPLWDFPVSEWHDGQTVKVFVGEKVTVKLMCRPGTGYSWHETVSDKGVLVELEESRFEPLPENVGKEDKAGGPELHVFRYVAKKAGTAKFSAVHARPHRVKSKILGSFEVTIEVLELR